jgi:hypothetical protein
VGVLFVLIMSKGWWFVLFVLIMYFGAIFVMHLCNVYLLIMKF